MDAVNGAGPGPRPRPQREHKPQVPPGFALYEVAGSESEVEQGVDIMDRLRWVGQFMAVDVQITPAGHGIYFVLVHAGSFRALELLLNHVGLQFALMA